MTFHKQPAILLVHSPHFHPVQFSTFAHLLSISGFRVSIPHQPTNADSRPPVHTFQDDVQAIRSAAQDLVSDGHPIIVFAHSFGGIAATESITEDLIAPEPRDATTPGVIRFIYVSAAIPLPGRSMADTWAKHGVHCDLAFGYNPDGTAYVKNAADAYYHDLNPSEAAHMARGNVTHNLGLVGYPKVHEAPWRDVRGLYIYCLKDRVCRLTLQEAMVHDVRRAGGNMDCVLVRSGHCPMFSRADELIGITRSVWDGAGGWFV